MKVNIHPKESLLFNAFLLIFIIHAYQTGVGIVGLPRIVYLRQNMMPGLLFLSRMLLAVVLVDSIMMLKQYDSADLYGIHVDVFGKWLGNSLNIIYMLYLAASFFIIFMNYIEIVQVWIFPNLPTWQIALHSILLTVYAVYGGIRIIVGVAFLSVIGNSLAYFRSNCTIAVLRP